MTGDERKFLEFMDGAVIREIHGEKNHLIILKDDDFYFYKSKTGGNWRLSSAAYEYFQGLKKIAGFVDEMMKKHGL